MGEDTDKRSGYEITKLWMCMVPDAPFFTGNSFWKDVLFVMWERKNQGPDAYILTSDNRRSTQSNLSILMRSLSKYVLRSFWCRKLLSSWRGSNQWQPRILVVGRPWLLLMNTGATDWCTCCKGLNSSWQSAEKRGNKLNLLTRFTHVTFFGALLFHSLWSIFSTFVSKLSKILLSNLFVVAFARP